MSLQEETAHLVPLPGSRNGLSVLGAAAFLVGELAGSGVLALPLAMMNTGFMGIAVMLVSTIASAISGILLSKCWSIMIERNPEEFDGYTKSAFPHIGEYSVGKPMRYLISITMNLTCFGVCTVFLLLAAQIIQSLFANVNVHFSFCIALIVLAAVLIPFTWFGSPKDFPVIAVGASLATLVAVVIIFVSMLLDLTKHPDRKVVYPSPTFQSVFLGFGAMVFSSGGVLMFPTVQQDMRRPEKFPIAVYAAFAVMLALYLPVSITGYMVYGEDTSNNILNSLPNDWLRISAEIVLTIHLLTGFIIVLNPLSQDVESMLKITPVFGWRRCLARSLVVLGCLFMAESIPHFGGLLDLIGGSTITFLNYVGPPILFIMTCRKEGDWTPRKVTVPQKLLCAFLILLGVGGGIASTYSAILEIASPSTFIPPCYINMTAAEGP